MRAEPAYVNATKSDQIAPIHLLRIIGMPIISDPDNAVSVYLTDAEEAISFFDEDGNAEAYLPCGIHFDAFTAEKTPEIKSINLRIDNVSRDFCSLASQVEIAGAEVHVLRAVRGELDSPYCAQMVFVGRINSWTISEGEIEAEVIAPISLEQRVPRRLFWPLCQWKFGDENCGATVPSGLVDIAVTSKSISGGSYLLNLATKAFDNETSTYWASSQQGTAISGVAYIGQSNMFRRVQKIRLMTYSTVSYNISSIRVQYKVPYGEWVDLGVWEIPTTGGQWNEYTVPTYTAPQGEHSVRLLANANLASGYAWRVSEIEMLADLNYCNHTYRDCKSFNNISRFGGFPHLPQSRDPRRPWYKSAS